MKALHFVIKVCTDNLHPKIPIVNIENCKGDIVERMAMQKEGRKRNKKSRERQKVIRKRKQLKLAP